MTTGSVRQVQAGDDAPFTSRGYTVALRSRKRACPIVMQSDSAWFPCASPVVAYAIAACSHQNVVRFTYLFVSDWWFDNVLNLWWQIPLLFVSGVGMPFHTLHPAPGARRRSPARSVRQAHTGEVGTVRLI